MTTEVVRDTRCGLIGLFHIIKVTTLANGTNGLKRSFIMVTVFTRCVRENYQKWKFVRQLRLWLNFNAMLHQTSIYSCLSEAKRLSLTHCSQFLDDAK